MHERELNISGAVIYWSAGPTQREMLKYRLEQIGMGYLTPNVRTDAAALKSALLEVCATMKGGKVDYGVEPRKRQAKNGVEVICGDVAVATAGRVFDPKQVKLAGRGGTDMRPLIEAAAKAKKKPGVIVVCTDGFTPWPAQPVGVPVVVCLTRDGAVDSVPAWMDKVCLQ